MLINNVFSLVSSGERPSALTVVTLTAAAHHLGIKTEVVNYRPLLFLNALHYPLIYGQCHIATDWVTLSWDAVQFHRI